MRIKHESFPPALIKALLYEVSVFPPGTLVRLNTGEIGWCRGEPQSPAAPRVEVADAQGQRLPSPKIDRPVGGAVPLHHGAGGPRGSG